MYDIMVMLDFYDNINKQYPTVFFGKRYPTPEKLLTFIKHYKKTNQNQFKPEEVIALATAYIADTYKFEFCSGVTLSQLMFAIGQEFYIVSKKSKTRAQEYEFPLFFELIKKSGKINQCLCDDFIDFYTCYHTVITC